MLVRASRVCQLALLTCKIVVFFLLRSPYSSEIHSISLGAPVPIIHLALLALRKSISSRVPCFVFVSFLVLVSTLPPRPLVDIAFPILQGVFFLFSVVLPHTNFLILLSISSHIFIGSFVVYIAYDGMTLKTDLASVSLSTRDNLFTCQLAYLLISIFKIRSS
jgi:hypothetical protein